MKEKFRVKYERAKAKMVKVCVEETLLSSRCQRIVTEPWNPFLLAESCDSFYGQLFVKIANYRHFTYDTGELSPKSVIAKSIFHMAEAWVYLHSEPKHEKCASVCYIDAMNTAVEILNVKKLSRKKRLKYFKKLIMVIHLTCAEALFGPTYPGQNQEDVRSLFSMKFGKLQKPF